MMFERGVKVTNNSSFFHALDNGHFKLAVVLWENGASVSVLFLFSHFLISYFLILIIIIILFQKYEHAKSHASTTILSSLCHTSHSLFKRLFTKYFVICARPQ